MQKIDRQGARAIAICAEQAMIAAAKEMGLNVRRSGSASFNDSTCKLTFEFIAEGANPDREEFEQVAQIFGLSKDDFGAVFSHRGEMYEITGVNLRAKRYPIRVQRVKDAKAFKFPDDLVASKLKGRAAHA